VAREREHDSRSEGGDQPVAVQQVGGAEGEQPDAQRVKPLVALGERPRRQAIESPPGGCRQHRADGEADHGLERERAGHLEGAALRIAGEGEEEQHERQGEAVVEPGLEIEGVADPRWDPRRRYDR
jgi:hypothetical protein